MKVTKENVIAQVQNSASSIFSKEDVLFLINSLEVGSSRKITTEDIGRAIDKVVDSLERNTEDVVDYTSVEFNISYDNRIEVESVGLNLDYIREALENNFMDFGEAEVEEDVVELERVE
jgi:cell division ATPase FtsA